MLNSFPGLGNHLSTKSIGY